jgi:hypothetical protein
LAGRGPPYKNSGGWVPAREDAVSGLAAADLGIGAETWLFLALVGCVTLFFKFGRFWSVRNLDLLLCLAPAPGLIRLVGGGGRDWAPYLWLFAGSLLWLVRCLVDLGLSRRPLLEPNLNAAGLACLSIGVFSLLLAETVSLPAGEEVARNPAESGEKAGGRAAKASGLAQHAAVKEVLNRAPLPPELRKNAPGVILARVVALLAHVGLLAALLAVGWRHFGRAIAGLAVVACYLILPYSRIALVDGTQLVPSALVVAAVLAYMRPALAGASIGLAAAWLPACLGLIPLWGGFYRGRGGGRFLAACIGTAVGCGLLAWLVPPLADAAQACGARSPAQVGLWPGGEPPARGSFWSGIDPSYRLPVQIAYLALVLVAAFWPTEKNLGELIALSAALLVASQFWYLERGGTLILLHLPLFLLMVFRPNLGSKRPTPRPRAGAARIQASGVNA